MVFRCPVCKGPIAYWTMAPQFVCHHCRWQLSSNRNRVVLEGVAAGLVAEMLVALLLWASVGRFDAAAGLWLSAGGVVAYTVGWAVIRYRTLLTPRHPPTRHAEA